MNLRDENIPEVQRQRLGAWGMRPQQIGQGVFRPGIQDDEIIPLLRGLRRATFFTRDKGFYGRQLCHARYCLVFLDVVEDDVATFVRRFLRHPAFDTQAKRMGTVVRAGHIGLHIWRVRAIREEVVTWPP